MVLKSWGNMRNNEKAEKKQHRKEKTEETPSTGMQYPRRMEFYTIIVEFDILLTVYHHVSQ
jgi:hypothetical protein